MNKSLRTIIVIAAVMAGCLAITSEQKEKAEEHGKLCIEKVGVKSEDVLKIKAGDFSVTDPKIPCFAKCFFEEFGFMNAKGEFLDEVVINKLSANADKTKIETLVNTCKLEKGSDPCDRAYKIYKCYVENKAL